VVAIFSHGRLRVRDTCEWSGDAIQIQIPGWLGSQSVSEAKFSESPSVGDKKLAVVVALHTDTQIHMQANSERERVRESGPAVCRQSKGEATHTGAFCASFLFCFCHSQRQSQSPALVLHPLSHAHKHRYYPYVACFLWSFAPASNHPAFCRLVVKPLSPREHHSMLSLWFFCHTELTPQRF